LPRGLTRGQAEKYLNVSYSVISGWEKKHLVTPEKMTHQGVFYKGRQIARLIVIKKLREDGWDYPEIRDELCKHAYIAKNKDLIDKFLEDRLKNERKR
jgi:DNA-binding transcriptional MerR regulator